MRAEESDIVLNCALRAASTAGCHLEEFFEHTRATFMVDNPKVEEVCISSERYAQYSAL